jgi:ribosomal protein S27AE
MGCATSLSPTCKLVDDIYEITDRLVDVKVEQQPRCGRGVTLAESGDEVMVARHPAA